MDLDQIITNKLLNSIKNDKFSQKDKMIFEFLTDCKEEPLRDALWNIYEELRDGPDDYDFNFQDLAAFLIDLK